MLDWLRLLRAPNLLTVPGDPVAGYFLAAGIGAQPDVRLAWVAFASLLFYAGGLVMNDLVDRETDRVERPQRPLASGRVSVCAAQVMMLMFLLGGALSCAVAGRRVLIVAVLLLGAMVGYNLLRRSGPVAVALMGACRGLNVLLGAALAGALTPRAGIGVGAVFAFVAALTALARHEMSAVRPGWRAWIPAGVVLAAFALMLNAGSLPPETEVRTAGAFFFAFSLAGLAGWRWMEGGRAMAPVSVGMLIGALLPLQAALCLASGAGAWSLAAAFLLMLLWPLNRLLARCFAPS